MLKSSRMLTLMRPSLIVLLSCSLLMPSPAFPWWETGHQVVARIAAAHLTASARTRVARILDVPDTPQAVADALAKASTWADETKSQNNTGSWHFIDLTLEDHKSDIPERCEHDNCAPARIRLFTAQLSSRAAAPGSWSDLDALRFVVHFVGDVHQPLHATSDADLGGNCELLDPQLGKAKNLHALWDGEIVNAIDPNDSSLAASLNTEIQRLGKQARKLARGNPDDWVWESHKLAEKEIYRPFHIPVEPVEFPASCKEAPAAITELKLHVTAAYVDRMKPVVRTQLIKAGLRLAELLNQSL